MTAELPPITQFLIRHQQEIRSSSFTADELLVEFHAGLSNSRILDLMADLITNCNPVAAWWQDGKLRLAFRVQ